MLLLKTRVQPSAIHGLGLFAVEFVPAGTPIWRFEPGFDREFKASRFSALPEHAQIHLRWYAYRDASTGDWIYSGDHACFMNHASKPNTGALPLAQPAVTTVALRDIQSGEELTCDCFAFDSEARIKLG